MAFKIAKDSIDFGTTAIENIFINDFMPMANGTDVKVYLLGFKYASQLTDVSDDLVEMNNSILARHLSIPSEDVLRAWDFWEKKGIIKKHLRSQAMGDYDVEFLSLRQLYIDNNYSRPAQASASIGVDELIESTRSPELSQMFYDIDQLMRRQLNPKERQEILSWIYDMHYSPEMVLKAFLYAVESKGVKHLNYTRSILTHWYDQGIISPEAADEHLSTDSKAYSAYRQIYKTLGFQNRTVNAGDKEIIDLWLNDLGLDLDFILEVVKERATRTSNVNMKYLDAAIKDLFQRGIRTISAFKDDIKARDIQKEEQKKQKSQGESKTPKTSSNNRFHQFEQSKTQYSNDELEKLLRNRR